MSSAQLLGAVALGAGLAVYYASSFVPLPLIAVVGVTAYASTQTIVGRQMAEAAAARLGGVIGQPISPTVVVIGVCGICIFGGRRLLGLSGIGGEGGMSSESQGPKNMYQAYKLGFEHGEAGEEFEPPLDSPEVSRSSS
eukprot:SAG31_NODE_13531_length_863_cov_1.196335_1_plen_138_part_01